MKAEVKKILKERGCFEIYTDQRYDMCKKLMQYSMSKDEWLKMYLNLDPLNKAEWIADHLTKLIRVI